MEVAVKSSNPIRLIHRIVLAAVAVGSLCIVTGCGTDMLTYAQDAKREGIGQYNDGNYADAIGSFRNAVRQDPTDAEAEYWLGLSYEQTQNYHEAINAYKTALAVMPEWGSAHFNRGLHDKAFDRLARVIAQDDPANVEVDMISTEAQSSKSDIDYWLLGRIFRYRGDADTAMDDYHRSIQINPDNFIVQKELGLYLEQLGQMQEASAVLRDAYRLNQYDDEVNQALRNIGMTPGPDLYQQNQAKTVPPSSPDVFPGVTPVAPAGQVDGPDQNIPAPKD
jgi:tetratricopeptide (TPR) repeat protein